MRAEPVRACRVRLDDGEEVELERVIGKLLREDPAFAGKGDGYKVLATSITCHVKVRVESMILTGIGDKP